MKQANFIVGHWNRAAAQLYSHIPSRNREFLRLGSSLRNVAGNVEFIFTWDQTAMKVSYLISCL